ncbi:reverse transcriptase domain-containing protein, partial [Tanacetum coccineum]
MAERTMEELLCAPTEGYREAIVLLEINADHFEIKMNLLQLVQANPFYSRENDNPHAHINSFKRITSTLRFRNVPNDVIKLMMFPYSLEGAAKTWYEKELPNSILTWEDTEIKANFDLKTWIWDSINGPSSSIPTSRIFKTTSVGYGFYNALNANDQDSLNSAAGGNFLDKMPRECLRIIERISPDVAAFTTEVSELKNLMKTRLSDKQKALAPVQTNALADSGASINLLPHSIYKQLGLGALKPTRMTLELANRFVTHPMGIAEDVVGTVDGFTFLADFVVVNFEPDSRVPIILGRPFLRTAKALIDLYEEKLTLRVEAGSTTNHSNTLPPSSSPVKTSDNLEEFADELTLPKKVVHEENFQVYSNPLFEFDDNFTSSNVNPLFKEMVEDVKNENSNVSDSDEPVLLNTPLSDKVESFAPEDDIDEIDAFLAMEVSSNFEEGYFDSEGDVIFLENLLSDDTTHNLAPEVISDHESIHNTSITFSPRSDPLHHEFVGELLTLSSRIVREHEDYLNRITLLCEISTSRVIHNILYRIKGFLIVDALGICSRVYRNKKDERGIVIRIKARLVAQGYTQEEGIDYDEVFAPVARIEAIRLFLAYASFMGFIVYQMDVKSSFLYGTIEEEVYVCQPPSFEDPQFPDKVYKVEKALYSHHQAPRAWHETLSTYLLENGFRRGMICTDKAEITRKPSKIEQTRTRERKSVQEPEAKGLISSKLSYWLISSREDRAKAKKHKGMLGFTLLSLTEVTQ